jgi:(S)-2-hydroxyglutarate dehydrogenase
VKADVAIIGAGIVGLATALEIARNTPRARIVVLEKERDIATHQSGHNSGVIHSGIYYKPGTLKSRLCKAGAAEMLRFVRENGIPHHVCGKVIIAARPEQVHLLDDLFDRGSAIGLEGLRKIGPAELTDIEPLSVGIRALHIPSTAVTDYRAVCEKVADMLRHRDVAIANGVEILRVKVSGASVQLFAREM